MSHRFQNTIPITVSSQSTCQLKSSKAALRTYQNRFVTSHTLAPATIEKANSDGRFTFIEKGIDIQVTKEDRNTT